MTTPTVTERGAGVWLPRTEHHRIAQLDRGERQQTTGIVLHINEGTVDGTLSWWSRPGNKIGAHVEIGDSRVIQCVALEREAWHAGEANGSMIGIEHSGFASRTRTQWLTAHAHELALSANRAAWILHEFTLGHPVYGDNIHRHGDGGAAWGNHPGCPGPGFPLDAWLRLCHDAYYGHWGR